MGYERGIKTEHTGAKNGGGFHGTRADAKQMSKRARREADKSEAVSREDAPLRPHQESTSKTG